MGSLSFFTVHANKFVSTKNSRNPRRFLLAVLSRSLALSLSLTLSRSFSFTLPLFLSIRRIYLCECVWYMSVLSGGARPARSRHLCGIEASFPWSGELWAGDLILLHVWIVPKDITTRWTGRILRRYRDYPSLLQILFTIKCLLRHVFPIHRILSTVMNLHGLGRWLISVALLITILITQTGWRGARRCDIFQTLGWTLGDRF